MISSKTSPKLDSRLDTSQANISSNTDCIRNLEDVNRSYNFIIHNLHKVPDLTLNPSYHIGDEIENFLIKKCKLDIPPGFIDYATRLGSIKNNEVPILCKCIRRQDRDFICEWSNSIFLNIAKERRPYISEDLSPENGAINKDLVDLARKMRNDNSNNLIAIRYSQGINH